MTKIDLKILFKIETGKIPPGYEANKINTAQEFASWEEYANWLEDKILENNTKII